MRFGILGPLLVTDGTQTVRLPQGRQRLLLAVLLLHANEVLSVDRLIDALWGQSPPPTAARSLHNLVSGLRKALGDGVLVTEGRGYVLRVDPKHIDATHFEQLLDQGRAALARGDAATAAETLRDGLQLWRGPALADFVYEPAAAEEVNRLEELRLGAVEERIEADLALGHHAQVVPEVDRLVAEHPLRERLVGQQMLALYRCGRQADALRAFGDARRRMVEELGIEPGPALRRLETAVLEQDPALGVPDALPAAPAARGRRRLRPFALAGTGIALVAAALLLVLLGGGSKSSSHGLGHLAGNTAIAVDARTGRVVAEVPVGGTPTAIAAAGGAVWALNADDRTIARIDASSGQVRTVGLNGTPTDLAADAGGAWVGARTGDTGRPHVVRMDESLAIRSDRVLPQAHHQGAEGAPGQIAEAAGTLWAINDGEDLARIDARTGRLTATVRPLRAKVVAAQGTSVWVIPADRTAIVHISGRSGRVLSRIPMQAAELDALAVGSGAVWAADAYDGTLWRVEPGLKVLTRTIPVGTGANGVTVGAGAVWVINSLRGTLMRIDPRTNRVTRVIALGNTPRDVTFGDGRVWVTLAGAGPPVPAAVTSTNGPRPLPTGACGRMLTESGAAPNVLIASDFPLQAPPEFGIRPIADAVAFVLREHHFRAGRFRVGYQSCDSATAGSAQSDPGKCVSNAKAYAANSAVVGIVGLFNSDCTFAELPVLNRAPGGPLAAISPSNSLIGLTHRDALEPRDALAHLYPTGRRNYVRVYPADDAEAAADVILARSLHLHRVFVLDDRGPPGAELALHFRLSARAAGVPIVGTAHWDAAGHGFARLAARIGRAGADGVFVSGGSGSSGGPLVRALRTRLGRRVALIGPNPFGPVDFLFDTSERAVKGMYLSSPGLPNERLPAGGQRFIKNFAPTQQGAAIRGFAVYAAAATEVMLDAIARSNGTRASVTRALLATSLPASVIGPLRFDRNGDMLAPPVTIVRVRARSGVSSVPTLEGAAVERVITPPHRLIR